MPIDLRPVTSKAIDPATGKPQTRALSAAQESEKRAESDAVELTDAATRLKQAQAALASAEVVDTERVARVAQQLALGTYEIDAERIAEKLIEMELELASKTAP
jgi:negative regulator of flagellin synthesis FlgM